MSGAGITCISSYLDSRYDQLINRQISLGGLIVNLPKPGATITIISNNWPPVNA